jgi:hypothetical protein
VCHVPHSGDGRSAPVATGTPKYRLDSNDEPFWTVAIDAYCTSVL